MKKYDEPTREALDLMTPSNLREEYDTLMRHHIEETEKLYKRIKPPFGPSIIVIGPDRVGKTTLVAHIAAELNIPSFKCPAEKQIFKDGGRSSLAFDYTLTHFMNQTRVRFISDRGYPCEWVYSQVFDRLTDKELLERIDDAHSNLGTKILYLYSSEPPTEEDDLVPADKYWDVKNMYDKFLDWTHVSVTAIDCKDMLEAFRNDYDTSRDVALSALQAMGLK